MRWPVKVTPGEEAVWISLIVSLGMVMLTILVLWLWPDLLSSQEWDRNHRRLPNSNFVFSEAQALTGIPDLPPYEESSYENPKSPIH